MNVNDKLTNYLGIIKANFNIWQIIFPQQRQSEIKKYYQRSRLAYLVFHNRSGFMHMGISKDGVYQQTDLLEPLRIINRYIQEINAQRVLELGCGNGSNTVYLASINPTASFVGIDLFHPYIKGSHGNNYCFETGDYHNLERFPDNSLDLVFAIESLCHSSNKHTVLSEVYRRLQKDGILIIFDGYSSREEPDLTEEERLAKKLTEKSMAVESFDSLDDFNKAVSKTEFKVLKKENLTESVLPTLKRFERVALIFFKFPLLTKLLIKVLPLDVVKNSIAGLLMPVMVEKKIASYYLYVLNKTQTKSATQVIDNKEDSG